jgi:hypothetical protein
LHKGIWHTPSTNFKNLLETFWVYGIKFKIKVRKGNKAIKKTKLILQLDLIAPSAIPMP